MRPEEINKIVEYIKEQTDHKGDIFININKNAIPIEWLYQKRTLYLENECYMSLMVINEILNWWEKENEHKESD